MDPLACVQATKQTVGKAGGAFMLHPATMERAGELGLQPFPFYYLGRCGVLGDVDPDLVATTIAFFPPALVARSWRKGRAVLTPGEAASAYAGCAHRWGRDHLAAAEGLDRLCALVERVTAAADPTLLPLFAGWKALPLPDDPPARAAHLLHVLREHRGGLHIVAVLAAGLAPLEATLAGSGGADVARFFGWPEPFPEVTAAVRERRERAEALTDELASPAYAALSADERAELAELCAAVKAAAKAAAG
jgi:hypothetical protein